MVWVGDDGYDVIGDKTDQARTLTTGHFFPFFHFLLLFSSLTLLPSHSRLQGFDRSLVAHFLSHISLVFEEEKRPLAFVDDRTPATGTSQIGKTFPSQRRQKEKKQKGQGTASVGGNKNTRSSSTHMIDLLT